MLIILNTLVNFLESFGYTFFLYKYIIPKSHFKKEKIFILLIISILILSISSCINMIDQISSIILNIITFLFCYKHCENKPIEILFVLFYIETLIIISNISILFLNCLIFDITVLNIFNSPNGLLTISIISKIIFCILSYISSKFINKRNYIFNKSIFILLIITIITFICTTYGFIGLITGKFLLDQVFVFLISLSLTLILSFISFNIMKEENYQNALKKIEYQELVDMKFYLEAVKTINEENIRLKHCINSISLLTKKRNSNIINIINSKINNIQSTPQFINSNNTVLNNIINPIILLNKDLSWTIVIETDLMGIDKLDSALLISMLLKIAVEYINQDKQIKLVIKEINQLYLISIQFSCNNIINTENSLSGIKKTIDKYYGYITIESNNGFLCIDTIIKK